MVEKEVDDHLRVSAGVGGFRGAPLDACVYARDAVGPGGGAHLVDDFEAVYAKTLKVFQVVRVLVREAVVGVVDALVAVIPRAVVDADMPLADMGQGVVLLLQ